MTGSVVEKVRGADDSIKPGVNPDLSGETPGSHQEKLAQPAEWVIAEASGESLVGFNRVHLEEFNQLVAKRNSRDARAIARFAG